MLMKKHGVGAVTVVSNFSDPLVEGIVTDRDLCCAVVAGPKLCCPVRVADVMTRVPVTCRPGDTLAECQELMRQN
jgi:CBS domain-containing protein